MLAGMLLQILAPRGGGASACFRQFAFVVPHSNKENLLSLQSSADFSNVAAYK